ncbi:MAG TPA: SDR family oxidoreductase [Pseudonocardiaceae bacterium]|jgi:nucleoside-diphosphate-sugar epimerase
MRQIVDGANGFVASHLIAEMLARGQQVTALARSPAETVRQRVGDALACLGHNPALANGVPVLSLHLHQPDLGGLPAGQVFADPCVYWHSAALVTFNPGRNADMLPVNVDGTARALAVFERHAWQGSRFVAISTAYQCGLDTADVAEDWPLPAEPDRFRNFYEYTKRQAELLMRPSQTANRGNLAVVRLGVVTGHSRTGLALTDSGLYDFLRVITFYARRAPAQPVRIVCHPQANLHLMPIDRTIDRLLPLATADLAHPVFHLVGGAVPVGDVFAAINTHLPIRLVPTTPEQLQQAAFTRFEAAVNMQVKYTATYLKHRYGFQVRDPQPAQAVTPAVLDRLIGWYVSEGFPS